MYELNDTEGNKINVHRENAYERGVADAENDDLQDLNAGYARGAKLYPDSPALALDYGDGWANCITEG